VSGRTTFLIPSHTHLPMPESKGILVEYGSFLGKDRPHFSRTLFSQLHSKRERARGQDYDCYWSRSPVPE
jgi:hypothetical protein